MKKIFIFFLFFAFNLCFSQTFYLNVNLRDGTRVKYNIEDVNKIDFSEITSIKDSQKLKHIVNSFKLFQNYPNPFNPSTTIQYEIPRSGNVEISIYDLNGRLIKNIISESQKAGLYKTIWNGSNKSGKKVASGLYIYTIKFENNITSKKMILIK